MSFRDETDDQHALRDRAGHEMADLSTPHPDSIIPDNTHALLGSSKESLEQAWKTRIPGSGSGGGRTLYTSAR